MSRDLVLDVIAKKNSRDLSTLADEFDRLAKQTDDAGASMHKTTTFSKFLEEELAKTKVKVKELGDEFERTGNKDVFAKLRGAQSNVASLERIRKDLAKALDDGVTDAERLSQAKGGFWHRVMNLGGSTISNALIPAMQRASADASSTFGEGFLSGLGKMSLSASPALAPMVAALVTELLADVGGAIEAGAGLGGLATGIIVQFHDPAVKAAGHDLAHFLGDEMMSATEPFKEPLIAGLQELKGELLPVTASLRGDFQFLAPYVQLFARSLGDAAQRFMPGFNSAVQQSGPMLQMLARELPKLGESAGKFFDEIGQGGAGEVEALNTLLALTENTLVDLGAVIRDESIGWDAYVQAAAGAVDWTDKWLGSWTLFGPLLSGTGIKDYIDGIAGSNQNADVTFQRMLPPMAAVTVEADNQKKAVDDLKKSWDDYLGIAQTTDQAELTLARDTLGLKDALAQNKGQWDLNTKAGQDHRTALQGVLADNKAVYDAQVKQYGDNPMFLKAYQDTIDKRLTEARATGAAADYVEHLRIEYLGLVSALNSINGKVVHYSIIGTSSGPAGEHGFYQGLASGGRVPGYAYGGGVIKVGEMGPEYLSLPPTRGPAYITPNSAINGAANGGGQVLGVIEVRVTNAVTGEVIRTELVNVARQRGYRTIDALLPVGSAR